MRPTPHQIARFTADLHAKHDAVPGMARRIDRAAALAAAGDVRTEPTGFAVLSARKDGSAYHLDAQGRCTCPDFHNGAPQVRGIPFCKHRLAFNIVHRALVEALAQRILGSSADALSRFEQRTAPNTYLTLIAGSTGSTGLWSDRFGHLAQVAWSQALSAWQPATAADTVAVDRWLAQAAPLPLSVHEQAAVEAECNAYDERLADAEGMSSAWPLPAFRRWLDTGALPAYQGLDAALDVTLDAALDPSL